MDRNGEEKRMKEEGKERETHQLRPESRSSSRSLQPLPLIITDLHHPQVRLPSRLDLSRRIRRLRVLQHRPAILRLKEHRMTRCAQCLRVQTQRGVGGGKGEPGGRVEVIGVEVGDEDLNAFRLGEGGIEIGCEGGADGFGRG